MAIDPPYRFDPHRWFKHVHWRGGSLLVLSFVFFTDADDTSYDLCTIKCPTGPGTSDTYPVFSKINNIPDSTLLTGAETGIFTAKDVVDCSYLVSSNPPGILPYTIREVFQTIFINPRSFYVDPDGFITFEIEIPALSWALDYVPMCVMWDKIHRTDTPYDWTYTAYGIVCFDQNRFWTYGGDFSPSGGQIFDSEAAARASTSRPDDYSYYTMPVDVQLLETSIYALAGNYTLTSIGGPDGAGGTLPGPFAFPLDTPEVVVDGFGRTSIDPGAEYVTYWSMNYAVGWYTPLHPWPERQYWDLNLGVSSVYPDAPATRTVTFKIDTHNNAIFMND